MSQKNKKNTVRSCKKIIPQKTRYYSGKVGARWLSHNCDLRCSWFSHLSFVCHLIFFHHHKVPQPRELPSYLRLSEGMHRPPISFLIGSLPSCISIQDKLQPSDLNLTAFNTFASTEEYFISYSTFCLFYTYIYIYICILSPRFCTFLPSVGLFCDPTAILPMPTWTKK